MITDNVGRSVDPRVAIGTLVGRPPCDSLLGPVDSRAGARAPGLGDMVTAVRSGGQSRSERRPGRLPRSSCRIVPASRRRPEGSIRLPPPASSSIGVPNGQLVEGSRNPHPAAEHSDQAPGVLTRYG